MPLVAKARSFLRNLFFTERGEVDLDQEVRSHLQMLIDENFRAGMGRKEAERAARLELGGTEQVKEQVREKWLGNGLRSVIRRSPTAALASDSFARIPALLSR